MSLESFERTPHHDERAAWQRLEAGPDHGPRNFAEFAKAKTAVDIDDISKQLKFPMSQEDLDKAFELAYSLIDYRSYDERFLDSQPEDDIEYEEFQQLASEDRRLIERAIVYTSISAPHRLLKLLRCTGLEKRPDEMAALERAYETPMPYAWVALPLFALTYALWNSRHEQDLDSDEESSFMSSSLEEALQATNLLKKCRLTLTHATTDNGIRGIAADEGIDASKTAYTHHYEGDGVYTGMLGGYRGWNENLIVMKDVAIADTLPIITTYNDPTAMANILAEGVWVNIEAQKAFVDRPFQWRDCSLSAEINQQKITLLSRFLKTPVSVIVDDDECDCAIADTQVPPVVWGSLCRALGIRRFIPMSEVGRFAPELWERAEAAVHGDIGQQRVDVVKRYQQAEEIAERYGDEGDRLYIKGIRGEQRHRKDRGWGKPSAGK